MAAGELHTLLETETSQPLAEREPPGDRPWVALNMASSADGRAAVGGTSGGLGGEADHRQFAALRRETDCVLVGTGTLATERYGSIIRDAAVREERLHAGRPPQPMCCIVSRSGRVPLDIPLFHDPEQLVALYTGAPVALEGVEADIDVDAASPGFAAALRDLRTRRDVRVVLCEGGPRVVGALLAQGPGLSPPVPLELIRVLESDGYLFLRYLVAQPR